MQLELKQPINKQIIAQRKWYLKHPNYINRVSKRGQPYLHLIVSEIEKRGLPLELALLPIVESAFDPFAYSHGRASGMWQIIPGTGTRFGLAQNWWYDGRRDVYASTNAALDYLEYLHKYFKGDWLHAIAAYNSGEGRVGRAIKKNRKAGKPTNFWSLKLPKETKDYVPRLLALAQILKDPQQFDITWPNIANEAKLILVDTKSQIDLAFAAKLADMELNELHRLNPGFNRWATDPNGSHQLLLPLDKAGQFSTALSKTKASDRVSWVRYKIKNGDNLGVIAKRHQTTVAVIQDVNDINSSSIRAGKFLLIPVSTKDLSAYKLSAQSRLAKKQSQPRKGSKRTHIVKSGDNFWDIGRKYQVNHKSIAKWNGMAPKDTLRLGQKLVIWTKLAGAKTSGN
ncbi:MAG: transglycosylase SLT domain-containing protein, partial [Gammaproteobacteria bacterium]|nr:transglycosylase SLT domain-containing protein [Gammaproteobacteria bacterium]